MTERRVRHPADYLGTMMGDQHWPLPDQYDFPPRDFIAVDKDSMKVLAVGEAWQVWTKAKGIRPDGGFYYGEKCDLRMVSSWTPEQIETFLSKVEVEYPLPVTPNPWGNCIAAMREMLHEPYPEGLIKKASEGMTREEAMASPNKESKRRVATGEVPTRPASTNATGKVWDIADRVVSENPGVSIPTLRSKIIEACIEAGINPATAQVQYSKWKRALEASK